jgi:acetolactate synthase-1/3 small subunit
LPNSDKECRHVFTALVENKSGVLAHVSGLFSSRGFNIDSLAVGETENPQFSRMTIVARGDEQILEQIMKQLRKLIYVIKVQDVTPVEHVERDLILVRVNAEPHRRQEICEIAHIFRANIVDVGQQDLMLELTGDESKIGAVIKLLRPYGIKEVARTGTVAMLRGKK